MLIGWDWLAVEFCANRYRLSSNSQQPIFFRTAAEFRRWLKAHHSKTTEQWIGFYRKDSNRPSITWPESVDEALCFGWIDGLRKSIDAYSYKIRFTPRRATTVWSAVNARRMRELIRAGRVQKAGLAAFDRRTETKTAIYSYENRDAAILPISAIATFRRHRKAWRWFTSQSPSYRQTAIWWVVSAKRPETRQKRLEIFISDSASGRKIAPLRKLND